MDIDKISFYIITTLTVLLLAFSIVGFSVKSYQLGKTRSELELVRTELAEARDRQQFVTDTIGSCIETTARGSEILSQSAATVADIRKQVEEIRNNYQDMESRLRNLYDIYGSTGDNTVSGDEKLND